MKGLRPAQLRALSDFANTVAAAWFSAGIISPFFTKSEPLIRALVFPLVGLLMTWVILSWSLSLVRDIDL